MESRLPEEISITSDIQIIPHGRKRRGIKSLWMKCKKEFEHVGLKLNIQKTKIMACGPITSWEIDGEPGNSVMYGCESWTVKKAERQIIDAFVFFFFILFYF